METKASTEYLFIVHNKTKFNIFGKSTQTLSENFTKTSAALFIRPLNWFKFEYFPLAKYVTAAEF